MSRANCRALFHGGSREGKTDRRGRYHFRWAALAAVILVLCTGESATIALASDPFLPAQGSTSPPTNQDLNPYGLAVVPEFFPLGGSIEPGQLLVSNFNNSATDQPPAGAQGQGSTIVTIDPNTAQQVGIFFQGAPPIGFTNALSILRGGFVLAGSVFTGGSCPTTTTACSGGLLVLDRNGHPEHPAPTITSGINGPWGLAVNDQGATAQLFISNVLDFQNDPPSTCTITRLNVIVSPTQGVLVVGNPTTIASGYSCGPDSAGLVVGPAGLVYSSLTDTLYVAAEGDNEIFAIPNASRRNGPEGPTGTGVLVYQDPLHLHGPLGLMMTPNGDFVTANADPASVNSGQTQPSELVEFMLGGPVGHFVRQFSIDPNSGSAFAILNFPVGVDNLFAYVDDTTSTVSILELSPFPAPGL